MPEGPEVEIVRRGLKPIIGLQISNVKVSNNPKYQAQRNKFNSLIGYYIEKIDRRAKFLLWKMKKHEQELIGLNHLGMTGIWHLFNNEEWKRIANPFKKFKHYKLYFSLENNFHLLFVDIRTFGKFQLFSPKEIETLPALTNLGPDILSLPFDNKEFLIRVKGKNRRKTKEIGRMLLDYNIVSGCGNIYKSEALYRAKIHPMTPANQLNDAQIYEIGLQLSNVGQEALDNKGSTIQNYQQVDGYTGLMQYKFNVYGKSDTPCQNCEEIIVSGKQGDRTSYWCPNCQFLPKE